MKKSVIAGIMLAACTGANAQNVQDPVASITYDEEMCPILPEFTIDNKAQFMVQTGESTKMAYIYNDDIKQIATITLEGNPITYSVIMEREAVEIGGYITFTGNWKE